MKVNFLVRYTTQPGQNLFLGGDIPELGQGRLDRLIPMQYLDQEFWSLTIHLPEVDNGFGYRYYVDHGQGAQPEGEHHRVFKPVKKQKEYFQVDTWIDASLTDNVFFTAPFYQRTGQEKKTKSREKFTHRFKIKWALPTPGEQVALIGAAPELGNWDLQKAIPMHLENGWWTAEISLAQAGTPVAYKYGLINTETRQWIKFENGPNRTLRALKASGATTTWHDGYLRVSTKNWRGAGVAIPVFSLRSKSSWGVGEFNDLKLMAQWAAQTGLKMIQVLPINDTFATGTWTDSYPYAAISAFALHPLYLNPEAMVINTGLDLLESYAEQKQALNAFESVDYLKVMALKWDVTNALFEKDSLQFLQEMAFKEFFAENKSWLEPYALFCFFRDKNKHARFNEWPEGATYTEELLSKYTQPKSKAYRKIVYYYFLQYHLHLQLKEAVAYAHRLGVFIKGDIPIGIYRHSCDAWVAPQQYFMDQQAGAPPDDFAVKGQNWGFPTYNWPVMQSDNFQWWRKRFAQMSHYFDAFRIDHILGFFRIWSIPMHAVEGLLGRFVPAIPLSPVDFTIMGIPWDKDRYCLPFIQPEVVKDLFGDYAAEVLQEFCIHGDGGWQLKPEFEQQIKIRDHFDKQTISAKNERIKQGLFDLVANVILLPDEQSDRYHFRISMEQTTSFSYLPEAVKERLKSLYIDYFYHKQDDFWQEEAIKKLPHLKQSTDMLICGEDLGMVPHGVPKVMNSLGILSLEIQRMPKDPLQDFFIPANAPYLAVVTPSTHDMSTIRGWWLEDRTTTQRFYNQVLEQWGEAPAECPAWINKMVIQQHLHSPAMWAIFQWQELTGMDEQLRRNDIQSERINIPAIVNYWRYRMHIYLEDMLKEKHFNEHLQHLISTSGR